MVILSSSLLFIPAGIEIPEFEKVTAKVSPRYLRRVDRFTQIALWGAIDCISRHEISADTPMILISDSGGKSSMKSLKECVINENHLPAPYTFISTLANSASFLIAKALSLVSENVALCAGPESFRAVINYLTKSSLLGNNRMVFLGFVEEGDEKGEGLIRYDRSTWFLLSKSDSPDNQQMTAAPVLRNNVLEKCTLPLPPEILHAANYTLTHANIIL